MANKVASDENLVKIFGQRLRLARELAGMSQTVASEVLGFTNSSGLAKRELADYTASIDIELALRAAELYGVSVDFLFGLSSDPRRSLPAVHAKQAAKLVEHATSRQYSIIKELFGKVLALSKAVGEINSRTRDVKQAVYRFVELNQDCFDDMPGGARLLQAVNESCFQAKKLQERLSANIMPN